MFPRDAIAMCCRPFTMYVIGEAFHGSVALKGHERLSGLRIDCGKPAAGLAIKK
jgi:hypothetical protein